MAGEQSIWWERIHRAPLVHQTGCEIALAMNPPDKVSSFFGVKYLPKLDGVKKLTFSIHKFSPSSKPLTTTVRLQNGSFDNFWRIDYRLSPFWG